MKHHDDRAAARALGALATLLCAALGGCGSDTLSRASAQGKNDQAPHGAQSMAAQQKTLDELKLGSGAAPHGVNAEVWAATRPSDNEPTAARIALGRKLYFDPKLSKDGTVACATCHDISRGLADRRPLAEGIGDRIGRRNTPTSANAALLQVQFWDGRAGFLEDQAKLPITNPIEMGMENDAAAVAAIASDAAYQKAFQDAYGRPVNMDDIARAIASFERTLIFLDAPFDRFVAGDASALSADAQRGFALFQGKARCVSCHAMNSSNPLGTNNKFHNIGVSARHKDFEGLASRALKELEQHGDSKETQDKLALETDLSELGRFVVTKSRMDIGAFRTPQLRNVGVTGPYMHDGSLNTLWDVMDHYNKGGEANPYLDGGIEPLALTDAEINDVVAFLFALTDVRFAEQNKAEQARQRELAALKRPFMDEARAMRKTLTFETRLSADK